MIFALYAALCAFLMCWLSLNVIKTRRKHRVSYADGGVEELQIARSAQSNAVDYIPISLILLAALEFNGGHAALIHLGGAALLAGRLVHCRGILTGNMKGRVLGMQITFWNIIALAALNLFYLPYGSLFSLV